MRTTTSSKLAIEIFSIRKILTSDHFDKLAFSMSQNFIDNEKAMLIPTKASRDIRCGQQQIRRLYVRNLKILASKGQLVSVSAFENIASSMNFLYSEKVSLSK